MGWQHTRSQGPDARFVQAGVQMADPRMQVTDKIGELSGEANPLHVRAGASLDLRPCHVMPCRRDT